MNKLILLLLVLVALPTYADSVYPPEPSGETSKSESATEHVTTTTNADGTITQEVMKSVTNTSTVFYTDQRERERRALEREKAMILGKEANIERFTGRDIFDNGSCDKYVRYLNKNDPDSANRTVASIERKKDVCLSRARQINNDKNTVLNTSISDPTDADLNAWLATNYSSSDFNSILLAVANGQLSVSDAKSRIKTQIEENIANTP